MGTLVTAHRAALDHVLSLIAGMPWSDALVLRGSRLMSAWAPERARAPADLDFVVLPDSAVPIDTRDPYPYVSGLEVVQEWPEFAGGAGQCEIWKDGDSEFWTGGIRAITPPEGLRWEPEPDPPEFSWWLRDDLGEALKQRATCPSPSGVVLDADGTRVDDTWTYAYRAANCLDGDGPGGIRLVVPWRAPDGASGEVQVDFAMDERLPEPPAWTRVPLESGAYVVLQGATPEAALAWKLLWLHRDSESGGGARAKDLYDAVVLAEDSRTRLSRRLLRRVFAAPVEFGEIEVTAPGQEEWAAFAAGNPGVEGAAGEWAGRLRKALRDRG